MNAIDVIKTELACVQRDCCRVENQCAKCDLVLPVEEIISAYNKCISVLLEDEELENKIADIKANCDLAIEGRDVKIMELEQQIEEMKCWHKMDYNDKESCKKIPQGIQLLTEYDCGLFVAYCVNRWTGDHWEEHSYGITRWKEIK